MNGPLSVVMPIVTIAILIAWVAVLVRLLQRTDLDGTTKISWVIVLCVLNVLGLFIYLFFGPKPAI